MTWLFCGFLCLTEHGRRLLQKWLWRSSCPYACPREVPPALTLGFARRFTLAAGAIAEQTQQGLGKCPDGGSSPCCIWKPEPIVWSRPGCPAWAHTEPVCPSLCLPATRGVPGAGLDQPAFPPADTGTWEPSRAQPWDPVQGMTTGPQGQAQELFAGTKSGGHFLRHLGRGVAPLGRPDLGCGEASR